MKIKVSVIVPVYNVEKFIDKCLNSLVKQSLKEIEIIVVNDGSPDNSQKIIDKYVKKYPEKVQSFIKENGGQGSARNIGIVKAKGEYISFVDSDDWLDLDALEKMYSLAKKDNSDIVICDMVDHYANYTIYHNCTKYNSVFEVTPSACNKIFKKELIKDFRFFKNCSIRSITGTPSRGRRVIYGFSPAVKSISPLYISERLLTASGDSCSKKNTRLCVFCRTSVTPKPRAKFRIRDIRIRLITLSGGGEKRSLSSSRVSSKSPSSSTAAIFL